MGGLITVTSMLNGETRIRKAFTLGTPYEGTWMVYKGWLWGLLLGALLAVACSPWVTAVYWSWLFFLPSLRQMRPGSPFLSKLSPQLPAVPNVQCLYATRDEVVIAAGF
jgi:hypothetical protein